MLNTGFSNNCDENQLTKKLYDILYKATVPSKIKHKVKKNM